MDYISVMRKFRDLYKAQAASEFTRYRGWIHSRLAEVSLTSPEGEVRAFSLEGLFRAIGAEFPQCLQSDVASGRIEIRPVFAHRRDGRRFLSGHTVRLREDTGVEEPPRQTFNVIAALGLGPQTPAPQNGNKSTQRRK